MVPYSSMEYWKDWCSPTTRALIISDLYQQSLHFLVPKWVSNKLTSKFMAMWWSVAPVLLEYSNISRTSIWCDFPDLRTESAQSHIKFGSSLEWVQFGLHQPTGLACLNLIEDLTCCSHHVICQRSLPMFFFLAEVWFEFYLLIVTRAVFEQHTLYSSFTRNNSSNIGSLNTVNLLQCENSHSYWLGIKYFL